ncbi:MULTISPECIES: pore-forming ESAT-6 family protein [Clostridium]|uniref:pore-forming ESAT-6 family protein n=1 Tax=Clostridium TaxID=1485 RepID=UPI0008265B2E|nr:MULTISPECIES: pore-forming ESAT-6 family protein [Clostridium]PJI09600.1 WXG100 family type VII secretion target [Clostridium sp. CT7]
MASDGIKISFAEVSKTASSIRNLNQSLTSELEDMKREVNGLNGTWQSDAGNTIRDKFNALAPKFDDYRRVVDSYARFLDSVVENYTQMEASINNNASAFR